MPRPPLPIELRLRLSDPDMRETYARTGLLTGRVDDLSGAPVHGAEVAVLPFGPATRSGLTGDFAIFAPAGALQFRVSAPGFMPVVVNDTAVPPLQEVVTNVTLRPRVAPPLPRSAREGHRHRESVR